MPLPLQPPSKLAKVRIRARFSQNELSKRSGVTRETIAYIEGGGGCSTAVYEGLVKTLPKLKLSDVRPTGRRTPSRA